jgi:2,4-diaminopentanoate dehydrogenase
MGADVSARDTYRVVQWATGNIGARALRAVIEHPDLELAGVFVYSDHKAGRDAGELCGLGEPAGVAATRDIHDVLASRADCVLYMPRACDFDDLCRLLEAGTNVVTTRGELHRPASLDPVVREKVEAACARGASSIHSTGSSPGFISEAVPLVLTSIQRRLDGFTIDEFANLSQRNSPDLLFRLMGFGSDPERFDDRRWAHGVHAFGPSLQLVAEALGLPLDSVEASGEVAVARHATDIVAGTLAAGTVAAQRLTVSGIRRGRPLMRFRATWYCTTDIEAEWDLRDTGWRLSVDGDSPLDVEMRLAVPLERMGELSPNFTANRAVNAIPFVCGAAPGIRTTVDLPQVIAQLGEVAACGLG